MLSLKVLLFCYVVPFCTAATVLPDTTRTGAEYLALAQASENQEAPVQAIKHYKLARQQLQHEQDYLNVVYALTQLADLHLSDEATQPKAVAYLDTAQIVLNQHVPDNDTLSALVFTAKANLALAQRKHYEAIEHYQQSLVRKRVFYGENHLEVARDLEEIGNVYLYNLQSPYESERFHQQVLSIREQFSDQGRLLANCYYHLSFANRLRGDYDKALSYAFKVEQGYKNLPEVDHFNLLNANGLLGTIYHDMDSIDKALYYNRKAIEIGGKIPKANLSMHYNNQAGYFFKKQAYDSSIYYARLAVDKQANLESLSISYQFLGNAYRGKGQMKASFANYRESQDLKKVIYGNYHAQLSFLYIDIGKAFDAIQSPDSALYYYQLGLENARTSRQQSEVFTTAIRTEDDLGAMEEALTRLTSILMKQYRKTSNTSYLNIALPYFELFDQLVDVWRADFSTEGANLILSSNHKTTYEQAVSAGYHLYQTNPSDSLLRWVFHFTEKSKAMVLLESIRQAERDQQLLPDSLVQRYQSLRTQLAYYQSELTEAEPQSAQMSEWQRQRADVLREIETLDQQVEVNYPNYYTITSEDFTISLDTLQKHLVSGQSAVSYFWGNSAVYALLVTPDTVKVHRTENTGRLKKLVGQYQDVLANDNISAPSYANFLQFQESAHQLYQTLLAPVLPDEDTEHLIIMADGELTKVPFESFITSTVETAPNDIRYQDLPYLIKTYEFSYELSASVAFRNRQRRKVGQKGEFGVAAFGIKNFENIPGHERYPRLGDAEEEVNYVQEKFPQAQIFLNESATEEAFKQQAVNADILHVATHGMVDLENPFDSKFIFYPTSEEDGSFYLYELYNMSLETQLLLLGTCESGVGKYYAGEGSYSLARNFVYAGCQSVVMSLWKINDYLTMKTIEKLYDQLAEQSATATALRNAKLDFIEDGRFAHPQCWAGLVLLGNTDVQFPLPYDLTYAAVALAVIVILSLIVFMRLRRSDYKRVLPNINRQHV
ncbi:CHAT domain-containing protein [Tunicatimonas pelagia]|uniref:CHAT domain-containing protein n=1 Tax=Tunicatimonas pelagia TaxID=931531 RepID=UPI0026666770|nr:CHAT domain-containing tetratricopeptide repeat protein [Tunicatimonas pelagia]WKN41540.1 CHAT domain-containing protein [Tunicatimonas pelagia]